MKLYRSFRAEVPEEYYTLPLGKAAVAHEGTDVTIVTYGYMVREALAAAETLKEQGVSVEVVDLRTVQPLDVDTIVKSVVKTGRLVVVQEAQRQAGIAANVMAEVAERRDAILALKAPIARVAAPDTVFAFGLAEGDWLPNAEDIAEEVLNVLKFD